MLLADSVATSPLLAMAPEWGKQATKVSKKDGAHLNMKYKYFAKAKLAAYYAEQGKQFYVAGEDEETFFDLDITLKVRDLAEWSRLWAAVPARAAPAGS